MANQTGTIRVLAEGKLTFQTKTGGFALVYCLNIGIDPPDVVKTDPCARLECWLGNSIRFSPFHTTDPTALPQQKALEMIGKALQTQYEGLQSNLPVIIKLPLNPHNNAGPMQNQSRSNCRRSKKNMFKFTSPNKTRSSFISL
jgi:hypothetical protein